MIRNTLSLFLLSLLLVSCNDVIPPPGDGVQLDFVSSSSDSLQATDCSKKNVFEFCVSGNAVQSVPAIENIVKNAYPDFTGGSAREVIAYKVERCVTMTVLSDDVCAGRNPGSDLADLFTISSNSYYISTSTSVVKQSIADWTIADYVKDSPQLLPEFSLQYIGEGDVEYKVLSLKIVLDNGKELSSYFQP